MALPTKYLVITSMNIVQKGGGWHMISYSKFNNFLLWQRPQHMCRASVSSLSAACIDVNCIPLVILLNRRRHCCELEFPQTHTGGCLWQVGISNTILLLTGGVLTTLCLPELLPTPKCSHIMHVYVSHLHRSKFSPGNYWQWLLSSWEQFDSSFVLFCLTV